MKPTLHTRSTSRAIGTIATIIWLLRHSNRFSSALNCVRNAAQKGPKRPRYTPSKSSKISRYDH